MLLILYFDISTFVDIKMVEEIYSCYLLHKNECGSENCNIGDLFDKKF